MNRSSRDAARFVPLVLAAGGSTRMGRPKSTLPFGDTTALGRILATCRAARLAPAVVVAGAHPEAVATACADAEPATHIDIVQNPDWAKGRASSIRAGLAAITARAARTGAEPRGFLLWPVDVCLPGAPVVAALLADAAAHPEPETLAWVPSFEGRRGHPILFAAAVAERLLALRPDEPARTVTRALADEAKLRHLVVADPTVRMEMNTPEEYARWRAHGGRSPSDERRPDC